MKRRLLAAVILLTAGCGAVRDDVQDGDTTGPYINLNKYVFETGIGEKIDFSYITGYDDVDGLVPVTVSGIIDYDEPGEYYPVLSAVDYSGNETLVGIVVIVREDMRPEGGSEPAETPEIPEETECLKAGAKDESLPCGVVLPAEAEEYSMLYAGEGGRERCEAAEEGSCEVLYTNDGTFWGYGLKKGE